MSSVIITGGKPLEDFAKKHPNSRTALETWRTILETGSFQDHVKLKQAFGKRVDYIRLKKGDFYVFDIGGNKYRIVTVIHFKAQEVFPHYVLTHAEYSTDRWKL